MGVMVAVLCVSRKSVYKSRGDVDCYDEERDCRTFDGVGPVVAHPPCEEWSQLWGCRETHVVVPGRRELVFFCLDAVLRCGGVLEHPAGSRLWRIVKPTIVVDQYWFGFPARKRTGLLIHGLSGRLPDYPLRLVGPVVKRVDFMSSGGARSASTVAFAQWLLCIARRCA